MRMKLLNERESKAKTRHEINCGISPGILAGVLSLYRWGGGDMFFFQEMLLTSNNEAYTPVEEGEFFAQTCF